jgi:chromosome segregation ATPase
LVRQSVEKKAQALEEQIKQLQAVKQGLEAELEENEATEARMKKTQAEWVQRCRELEVDKKAGEDKCARLDARIAQLEMSLAEARAKLYNVSNPANPEPRSAPEAAEGSA